MKRKELNEPYRLQREIQRDRDRLREMEARATSCGAALNGIASGSDISDKVGCGAVEIAMLRGQIADKIATRDRVICMLWERIETIDDGLTRDILKMRHLDCLSFKQIAAKLGGNNTEDGVKKRYYRIMKKIGAIR